MIILNNDNTTEVISRIIYNDGKPLGDVYRLAGVGAPTVKKWISGEVSLRVSGLISILDLFGKQLAIVDKDSKVESNPIPTPAKPKESKPTEVKSEQPSVLFAKVILDRMPEKPCECPFYKQPLSDGHVLTKDGCRIRTSSMYAVLKNLTEKCLLAEGKPCPYVTTIKED